MLWAWTETFGEGHAARLPFFACTLLTTLGLWGLTRRLFGGPAAAWTVFAFCASAYFLVYPDGYILPERASVRRALAGRLGGRGNPVRAAGARDFAMARRRGRLRARGPRQIFGDLRAARARRLFRNRARRPRAARRFPPLRRRGSGARAAQLRCSCGTPSTAGCRSRSRRAAPRADYRSPPKALAQILAALGAQLAALTPWIAWPVLAGLDQAARGGGGAANDSCCGRLCRR